MSLGARQLVPPILILFGLIALAQRIRDGEWSLTWAAYFLGGWIVLAVLVSGCAGIWALIDYLRGDEKRAREARLIYFPAQYFHVDGASGQEASNLAIVRLVPDLGIIEIELRSEAVREIVEEAVARMKRDVAPGAWVERLPDALSRLREQGFALRGPSPGGHYHDPGPT